MPFPINAKCNMDCVFCDRNWSVDEEEALDKILEDAPMSELGGMRAVLAGGEPTLHSKLPGILQGLRTQGCRTISIRTNGAWAVRRDLVAFLKKQGLTDVSLLFPSHDPATFDKLTRRAGAFQTIQQAIANFDAERIRVHLRIPLIRPTLHQVEDTIRAVPRLAPKARRIDLCHLDLADPRLQVSWPEINAAFPYGSAHPWPDVPPLHLDPGPGLPMCWVNQMRRWRLTPDMPTARGVKPSPCKTCFVEGPCSGVMSGYLQVYGDGVVVPFTNEHDDRREPTAPNEAPASLTHAPFEPVKGVTYECAEYDGDEATLASVRLRVGHECNRRCEFCFIPHHEKSVQDYDIPASIEAAVEAGARELVMTGGEPTLQNDLPGFVQQAKDGGVRRIVLQTNAMRLANPDFAGKLVDAGLTSTVVSLHSHRDDILSQIVGIPQSMNKILRGIENLYEAGLQTSVTHVIGPKNYKHMPEFVKFMVEESYLRRFCFIFATPMAWPMAKKEIVVRYSDAAPYLMEALDYCIEQGVIVDGLSFKCGAPACVVNGDPKYLLGAVTIPEENRTPDWIEAPACRECALRPQCYGVRRLYAWLYGTEEFKPIRDPNMLAESWNTGQHMPRRPRPKRPNRPDPVATILERLANVGTRLGISAPAMQALLQPDAVLSMTLNGPGGPVQAFRVRHQGELRDTLGAVELRSSASQEAARGMSLLTRIANGALGVPVGGAHGAIAWDGDPADLFEQYAAQLDAQTVGTDHLTPHTSAPWDLIQQAVDGLGSPHVGVLRRPLEGPLAGVEMTSVDSAIAAVTSALLKVENRGGRLIRYGVWGYGRAGRRFAKLFDGISLTTDQVRRPLMVGCADSVESVLDPRGLEFERISAFKTRHGRLPRPVHTQTAPPDLLVADLDLLVLTGRGPALDTALAEQVQASVVVDLTGETPADAEAVLRRRGILFIPTLLATAGPTILADLERLDLLGDSVISVRDAIARRTAEIFERVYALAESHHLSMSDATLAAGLLALVPQDSATPAPRPTAK